MSEAVELNPTHRVTPALGVQLYFWARVACLAIYPAGIVYLRTAVWRVVAGADHGVLVDFASWPQACIGVAGSWPVTTDPISDAHGCPIGLVLVSPTASRTLPPMCALWSASQTAERVCRLMIATGDVAMNAGKPTRFDRSERIGRSMLALALIAAVAWAITDGGAMPAFNFSVLRG